MWRFLWYSNMVPLQLRNISIKSEGHKQEVSRVDIIMSYIIYVYYVARVLKNNFKWKIFELTYKSSFFS